MSFHTQNPLSYMGIKEENPPELIIAQRNPAATDIHYDIGDIWINEATATSFQMTAKAAGLATWSTLGGATADVNTLSGDAGGLISPTAGNIVLAGGTNIGTTGAGSTITINLDNAITVTSVATDVAAAGLTISGNTINTDGTDASIDLTLTPKGPAGQVVITSGGIQITAGDIEQGTSGAGRLTASTGMAFSSDNNGIQSYVSTTGGVVGTSYKSLHADLSLLTGNGSELPVGVEGIITAGAASNVLSAFGVRGYCDQVNGSIIGSTAAGVEGHLNLTEVNAADMPAFVAFGVKGYLDATDGAGVPAGIVSGIGSIVEYNTPFNAKAFGVVVTRLNAGAGAGTAGQAAYGVVQGTVGIPDWLYGIDLYNGGGGFDYTNADIRLWNQALINSSATGVAFEAVGGDDWTFVLGDAAGTNKVSFVNSALAERASISSLGVATCRSCIQQNTNIPAFYASPLVQSALNTGAVPSGVAGDINLVHMQGDNIMEEFVITAQAILAPRMTTAGLEIGGDQIATNGYEYNFGANRAGYARHTFTSQTSAAFFVEATFVVTTVASVDPLWIGFRKDAANNGVYTNYTDAAFIGLRPTTAATVAIVGDALNGGAWNYTNTTNAWANGATIKVRVNVSGAGVVTYLINGAAPAVAPAAFTFDAGDLLIPCIHFTQAAAAFTPIKLVQFACGFQ
jgi:hypothetical protein